MSEAAQASAPEADRSAPWVREFVLDVPGEPRGQARPRARGMPGGWARVHDAPENEEPKGRIQAEWREVGRPRLEPGRPIALVIDARFARPATHYLRDGRSLSAEGRRKPHPTGRPDVTNIAKLVEDALEPVGAFKDAAIVSGVTDKRWCVGDEGPRTRVWARVLG